MRRLLLGLLVMEIAACDRSIAPLTLAPTDAAVAGSYGLTLVNGHALPFVAFNTNTDQWNLTSDRLILSSDGTWAETTNYDVISLSTSAVTQQHTQTSGTYAVGTSVITFTRVAGGALIFTGSVTGNILSLLFNGGQFTYSR